MVLRASAAAGAHQVCRGPAKAAVVRPPVGGGGARPNAGAPAMGVDMSSLNSALDGITSSMTGLARRLDPHEVASEPSRTAFPIPICAPVRG
mgnify:CR=1 FL=1